MPVNAVVTIPAGLMIRALRQTTGAASHAQAATHKVYYQAHCHGASSVCPMVTDTLIPFGLHVARNELVDVGNVSRGDECGCVCPSCHGPLTARQGDLKEWHFAHRSHQVHKDVQRQCDYSLAVSIRLMIRQLSEDGMRFRTPQCVRMLPEGDYATMAPAPQRYTVAEATTVELADIAIGVMFSDVPVDVVGLVKGVPLVIYVCHRTRPVPTALEHPRIERCGIVAVNVDVLAKRFLDEKKGQYSQVLMQYLEGETEGKTWIYHPRDEKARAQAEQARQLRSSVAQEREVKHFECVKCGKRWTGVSQKCDRCHDHLFTRVV